MNARALRPGRFFWSDQFSVVSYQSEGKSDLGAVAKWTGVWRTYGASSGNCRAVRARLGSSAP
jgi:hypothetical protein